MPQTEAKSPFSLILNQKRKFSNPDVMILIEHRKAQFLAIADKITMKTLGSIELAARDRKHRLVLHTIRDDGLVGSVLETQGFYKVCANVQYYPKDANEINGWGSRGWGITRRGFWVKTWLQVDIVEYPHQNIYAYEKAIDVALASSDLSDLLTWLWGDKDFEDNDRFRILMGMWRDIEEETRRYSADAEKRTLELKDLVNTMARDSSVLHEIMG